MKEKKIEHLAEKFAKSPESYERLKNLVESLVENTKNKAQRLLDLEFIPEEKKQKLLDFSEKETQINEEEDDDDEENYHKEVKRLKEKRKLNEYHRQMKAVKAKKEKKHLKNKYQKETLS